MTKVQKLFSTYSGQVESILVVTILLQIVVMVFVPNYMSSQNIALLLRSIPTYGVIALGMCLLMVTQEIDLSIGSTFALAPLLSAKLVNIGVDIWVCLVVSLIVGAAVGFVNGLITVKTKIPSFIATLGTMMIWRGLTYVLSGGQTVGIVPSEAFRQVFNGSVGIIPVQFIWLVALTVVFWVFMTKHTFGNHAMATGGDLKVAQALGLNTARIKVICFIVLGIVTALGANFDAVRVRTVFPTQGEGLALIIIAAVLIGGTKLNGGEGTIWGTFFGVVLIYTIQDVLLLLRVRAYYFQLFVGIVIIFAVIMNIFFEERKKQ